MEVIAMLSVPITGAIGWLAGRKKNNADSAKSVSEAVAILLEPMTKRIGTLESTVSCMRTGAEKHLREFDIPLVKEVRKLGGEAPDPKPIFE